MIGQFRRMLFGLKLKDRLDRAPRMYSNDYDRHVSRDVEKVFAASGARSPENVQQLLKQYKVSTIEELLPLLPDRQRRVNPRQRFHLWMMRLKGLLPYDPLPSQLSRLRWEGNHPDHGTLIYRTHWPYGNSPEEGGDQDA